MKRRVVALVLGLSALLGSVAGVAAAEPETPNTVVAGSSWT